MIPLTATAASAAVNSVTTNPSSYQAAAGSPVTVTADVSRTALDATPIRFAIVSGPDADQAGNGTLVADGTCTGATTPVSCTFTNTKGAGTDVVRVFADTNSNLVLDAGEPSSDASVVFYGAPAVVNLSPASDTAAAGTCNVFTATLTDAGGRAEPSKTVKLETTLTGTIGTRTLTYCVPNPNDTTPAAQAVAGGTTANAATPTATGTVTTDANGKAVFGITSDQPGTATVRAYFDTDNSGSFNAGEPTATSTKTFTSGGAVGNSAQDAVTALTVTPTSQNSVVGDTVTYTVTAKNSTGDTVPNVTVSAKISGPNSAVVGTFTPATTNNNGQTVFSYTPTAAGTDTITFFVNQTTGATSGADANEPQTTATDVVTAAPSGNTINITCAGTVANTSTKACVDPTTDNTEVFTAVVSKGVDANNKPIGVAGILVRFTTANTTAPGTPVASPTSAVTDANGVAQTTLTDVKEANGSVDTVTATIAGQTVAQVGGQSADTGSKTWQTAVPSSVTVAPALNTTQTGTASTFVATVKDQFGVPVAGVNTDFYIAGRNAALNGPALLNKVTDANGHATLTYTDTGAANAAGTDTITAVADVDNNDTTQNTPNGTATNNFITEAATAASVDLDVTGSCVGTTDPANDSTSYAPSNAPHAICATAKTAGGNNLAGKTITFTLSGVGSFVSADGKTVLTSPQTAVIGSNGIATVYVKSTQSGSQNVVATIDNASDSGVVTYTAATVNDARNIDLQPNTGNLAVGKDQELTARVVDQFGNPVQGIQVDFTETGAASFSNGTSSISGVTGPTGTVSVTLAAGSAAAGSTDTVTAAIASGQFFTNCADPAGTPADATTPGNCSDSSTYTYVQAGSVPSITTSANYIVVGQSVTVTVKGTPGELVELLGANNQNKAFVVFRTANIGSNGTFAFTGVAPRVNSYVQARTAEGSSNIKAIGVRPIIHMTATLVGTNTGVFTGTVAPGPAGRIVTIYYVTPTGVFPAINTTVDSNGNYRAQRTFVRHTRLLFVALTRPDDYNISNRSEIRTFTTR